MTTARSVSIPLPSNGALVVPWIARSLAAGAMERRPPADWAEEHGAPAQAVRILRSGVEAGSMISGSWAEPVLGESRNATQAFFASLATRSVVARIVNDNAIVRLPFRKRVGLVVADATGWLVQEGKPKPLSRLELTSGTIEPSKAAGMVVLSSEFINDASSATEQTINRSLFDAVSLVVDQAVLDQLQDTTAFTPIESSGTDSEDVMVDLRALLGSLQPNSGRLYFIGNADIAVRLSCILDSGGRAFPEMTPVGGSLVGIPYLLSNAAEDNQLMLLDAGALAGGLGEIRLSASAQASVEMEDESPSGDASTGNGASSVSMWQSNSVVIRAEVSFGFVSLRPAIAVVDNVNYGGTVTL